MSEADDAINKAVAEAMESDNRKAAQRAAAWIRRDMKTHEQLHKTGMLRDAEVLVLTHGWTMREVRDYLSEMLPTMLDAKDGTVESE